jgi:hypothetical protein
MRLIVRARDLYAEEPTGMELDATIYALDSTTIDLCLSLFDWAPFRSTKAAVKMHTLLDLRGAIPAFIHVSDGKMGDVNVLDILPVEAGAFYVMDRGYLDFGRLFKLHQAGAFFVTRAKRGMNARRVYSAKTDRHTGVICDQAIRLNGFYVSTDYPEHVRRIRYKDPESGKTLVFLTNNTTLPPLTIAALYKSRWQVELFLCVQRRLTHPVGVSPAGVKVKRPVAWMAACLGNWDAEAHRQHRPWGGGELPGRNESERRCGLEILSPEAEPPRRGRRQQGLSQVDWRGKHLRRGWNRRHGDKDVLSNWRSPPCPVEKSAEAG